MMEIFEKNFIESLSDTKAQAGFFSRTSSFNPHSHSDLCRFVAFSHASLVVAYNPII
jgi:hypothetical protein